MMHLKNLLLAFMAGAAFAVPAPAPTPAPRLEEAAIYERAVASPVTMKTAKCLLCPNGKCCKAKAMMPRATDAAKRWIMEEDLEATSCKYKVT